MDIQTMAIHELSKQEIADFWAKYDIGEIRDFWAKYRPLTDEETNSFAKSAGQGASSESELDRLPWWAK